MNPPPTLKQRIQFAVLVGAFFAVYLAVVTGGFELARRLSFPYLASGAHVTRAAATLGVLLPALWYYAGRDRPSAGRRLLLAILATAPSLALCVWGGRVANAVLDSDPGEWTEYRVAGYEGRGASRLVLTTPPGQFTDRLVLDRGQFEDEREVDTPVWVLTRPGYFHARWIAGHQFTRPAR